MGQGATESGRAETAAEAAAPAQPETEVGFNYDLTGDVPVVWLPPMATTPHTRTDRLIRIRDMVLAGLGLIAISWLLLLVAVAIRLDTEGPIIFRHERLGRGGRRFTCYKLRTMVSGAAEMLPRILAEHPDRAQQFAERFKLDQDPRVTRLGKWLRRLNIDELPQLWNVLVGDMSLVGPRPIVAEETARYGNALPTVLSVRPGMTGLWQVSGRSDTTYRERVALDLEYVETRGFVSDLGIIAKTLVQSFRRDNGGR